MNKNFVFRGKFNTSDYIWINNNKFFGGDIENSLSRLTTQQRHTINGVLFNNDYTAIFDTNYNGNPVIMQDPTVTKSFSKIIVNKTGANIDIDFSSTGQTKISFTDKYIDIFVPNGPDDVPVINLLPDRAIELSWTGTSWVLK